MMVFFIDPFGERKISHLALAIVIRMMAVLTLRILGAAVLAEPAIAKIKEVRGLVHSRISDFQISDLKTT